MMLTEPSASMSALVDSSSGHGEWINRLPSVSRMTHIRALKRQPANRIGYSLSQIQSGMYAVSSLSAAVISHLRNYKEERSVEWPAQEPRPCAREPSFFTSVTGRQPLEDLRIGTYSALRERPLWVVSSRTSRLQHCALQAKKNPARGSGVLGKIGVWRNAPMKWVHYSHPRPAGAFLFGAQ